MSIQYSKANHDTPLINQSFFCMFVYTYSWYVQQYVDTYVRRQKIRTPLFLALFYCSMLDNTRSHNTQKKTLIPMESNHVFARDAASHRTQLTLLCCIQNFLDYVLIAPSNSRSEVTTYQLRLYYSYQLRYISSYSAIHTKYIIQSKYQL